MKSRYLFIGCWGLTWCCVQPLVAQVSFIEDARSGIELLEQGNATEAETALERAIEQAIEEDVKGENRARTYYDLGLSRMR